MMLGLPISSFVLFILIPAAIVLAMLYFCWRIASGRDE
jgi:nitrogen fixation-related uncharacterized protein